MGSFAIVTVVTRNYLHYAEALALSLRQHCPAAQFFVCLADRVDNVYPLASTRERWLPASELGIHDFRRFAFQYTPFELSCALKPFAIRKLFDLGFDRVAYLDADMQVYSPLEELHTWLNDAALVLTPHATRPLDNPLAIPNSHRIDEQLFLHAGIFNAGFIALRRCGISEQFLAWWSEKLKRFCIDDLQHGLFVDQKWLDLAPYLFPQVRASRHFGYNAGHWTLLQIAPTADPDGRIRFGDDALACWHFSGFQIDQPRQVSQYLPDCKVDQFPMLERLFAEYAQRVIDCKARLAGVESCEFSHLTDGTPVRRHWREAIRNNHPQLADVEDPFDTNRTPDLVRRFQMIEGHVAKIPTGHRVFPGEAPLRVKRSVLQRIAKNAERIVRRTRERALSMSSKLHGALLR